MNKQIPLSLIKAIAPSRPPGYEEDILSHGKIENGTLLIEASVYDELCIKYRPHMKGVGDLVAKVAQPIARAIDRASGGITHISGCGGCKKRQEALNKAFPFKQ